MKEVLRMMHVKTEDDSHAVLNDYNLEVYEEEILYIFGDSGSGIHTIFSILAGKAGPDFGKLYLKEEELSLKQCKNLDKEGIYTIAEEQNLVDSLTVAENLYAVRTGEPLLRYYDKRKVNKTVQNFLKEENIDISADEYVFELSYGERQILSVLKAGMQGAKLLVFDFTRGIPAEKQRRELFRVIDRLRADGLACIIIAEKLFEFSSYADRIQLVKHGKDLMEWRQSPEKEERAVQRGAAYRAFEGFYDYEWSGSHTRTIWSYLEKLKENNAEFWEQNVKLDLLPAGTYCFQKTVFIPMNSANLLLDNMSISQNIALTISKRVGRTFLKYIPKALEENVARDFYRLSNADKSKKHISELTYLERKILSVYRWEVSRPDIILLESPYWGMDLHETDSFRKYLLHLAEKGIRIIFFSGSFQELEKDCYRIIITENTRSARFFKADSIRKNLLD